LQNNFDDVRYVYNRSLALKSYIYKLNSFTIGLKELKCRLSKLCNCHSCLKEVYNDVLQQSIINLDVAFKKFLNKQAKYFQFKSKLSPQAI
jgi:transposase